MLVYHSWSCELLCPKHKLACLRGRAVSLAAFSAFHQRLTSSRPQEISNMCLRVWGTGVHSSKVTFFLGGPVSLAVQRFDCDDCSLLVSSFRAQCGYFRRASASRNPRPAQVQRHGPPQRGFMPLELSARTCVGAVGQGERANHPRRRPTHSPAAGRMQILRWIHAGIWCVQYLT